VITCQFNFTGYNKILDERSDVEFQIIAGELCLDFVNTLDNRPVPDRRKELLPAYQDLTDWAVQAGALSPLQRSALLREAGTHPKAADQALRKAVELRECLYRIISSALRNRRASSEDLVTFNAYREEALSNLQLKAARSGFRLDWNDAPSRLDSILWPIVRSASDLLISPGLESVRECDMPACRWIFVDRSKNRRRRWCDMKVCGNRAKARKFYRRQKNASQFPNKKSRSELRDLVSE
jgi:predicted RNA-binding Zn ribbon-like protein